MLKASRICEKHRIRSPLGAARGTQPRRAREKSFNGEIVFVPLALFSTGLVLSLRLSKIFSPSGEKKKKPYFYHLEL